MEEDLFELELSCIEKIGEWDKMEGLPCARIMLCGKIGKWGKMSIEIVRLGFWKRTGRTQMS